MLRDWKTRADLAFGLRALAEALWDLAGSVEGGMPRREYAAKFTALAGIIDQAEREVAGTDPPARTLRGTSRTPAG